MKETCRDVPASPLRGVFRRRCCSLTHEISHLAGANEDVIGFVVPWLHNAQLGTSLMFSLGQFQPNRVLVFGERDRIEMAPILSSCLDGSPPAGSCMGSPAM